MNRNLFRLLLILLTAVARLAANAIEQEGDWVMLTGKKVFRIDHSLGSLQPGERAARTSKLLEVIINDPAYRMDSLRMVRFDAYDQIICQDIILISISDQDTAGTRLVRAELTNQRLLQLQTLLKKTRAARAPEILLQKILSGGLVILLLFLLLWINRRLFIYFRKWAADHRSRYREGFRFRGHQLLRPQIIHSLVQRLLRMLQLLVAIVLIYVSLPVFFGFFPATQSWGHSLLRLLLIPLQELYTGFVTYLPNLVTIVVIGFVFRLGLKVLRFFAREIQEENIHITGFHADWAYTTYKLIRVPVLAFFLIIIFPYLPGSSSPAFQGVTVFLGLLLSLGSTAATGNIIAGVVITYMRPFKKGDRITVGQTTGYVLEKTLLVTRIRSIKNEFITIPNSTLLNNNVVNYSRMAEEGRLILYTQVTIGYNAPWKKVHALLTAAASQTPGLLQSPAPFVLQRALHDFYITYEINAYCSDTKDLEAVYSGLHAQIQDHFNEGGVEIMSPHYTALRDGNRSTIPGNYPPGAPEGGFRIQPI